MLAMSQCDKAVLLRQGTAEEDILHGSTDSGNGSGGSAVGAQKAAGSARHTRNKLFRALHRAEGVRASAVA